MNYLSEMSEDQTLVLYSGHPMGLFPSSPASPRMVVTNGLVRSLPARQNFSILNCNTPEPRLFDPKSVVTGVG